MTAKCVDCQVQLDPDESFDCPDCSPGKNFPLCEDCYVKHTGESPYPDEDDDWDDDWEDDDDLDDEDW